VISCVFAYKEESSGCLGVETVDVTLKTIDAMRAKSPHIEDRQADPRRAIY
jgi:hypothetical protein